MNENSKDDADDFTLDDLWLYAKRKLKLGDPVPVDFIARLNDAGYYLENY